MTTVLQRVCWNIDSWTKPSGETVDSGNPGKHGFGNEEWNFCKEDKFGGYVFGWLHWSGKKVASEHFEILFWTIRPPEKSEKKKEWLLVGAYHDASLATEQDLEDLDSYFAKKRVYDRRKNEVRDVLRRPDQLKHLKSHPPAKGRGSQI